MFKKFFYISLFLICVFIEVKVFAVNFTCEYKFYSEKDKVTELFILEFDTVNGKIINHSTQNDKEDLFGNTTKYGYNYNFVDDEIKTYKENVCPILFMTKSVRAPQSNDVSQGGLFIPTNQTTHYTYYFFSDSYAREVGGPECVSVRDDLCLKNVFKGEYNAYYTGTLTDGETNKNNIMASICPTFDVLHYKIEEQYKKCEDDKKSCVDYIYIANNYIKDMRQTCNSILNHRDYSISDESGIISSDACVTYCLDLYKIISTLEKTFKKFITWICKKFSNTEEEYLIRKFQQETDTYINPEKQIEYENLEEDEL